MCYVHSECCYRFTFQFRNNNENNQCTGDNVQQVGWVGRSRICSKSVCGDGKPPGKGFFSGISSCNVFGCNCDGGCVPGEGKPAFKTYIPVMFQFAMEAVE